MLSRLTTILLLVLIAHTAPVRAQDDAPKIGISKESWDFGTVDQGERRVYEIDVKNSGSKPLHVGRVGVTCGCITASIADEVIAPGKSSVLTIKLDSTTQSGPISKHVFLDTNDRTNAHVLIPVSGVIKAVLWTSVANINFGSIDAGKETTKSFRVIIAAGRNVKVTGVHSSSGRMTVTPREFGKMEEEHGVVVDVTMTKEQPIGRFQGRVTITTDFALIPVLEVNIEAQVLGSIGIAPEKLAFPAMKLGETRTQTIRISKREGAGFAIEKVTCTDPNLAFVVKEVEKEKSFEIECTYTAKKAERWFQGQVGIWTNDSAQRLFTVNYTGSVRTQ